MNAPASSLLLPEDDDLPPPPAFQRLLYHYIRAVQQQHQLSNSLGLQLLIEEVDEAIRRSFPNGNPEPSSGRL